MAHFNRQPRYVPWYASYRNYRQKRRGGPINRRVYPDKLSRGQVIFLIVMSIALVLYIIIQLTKTYGGSY